METGRAHRACETCKQRRVKCDKRLPKCQRCENLGRPCAGYAPVKKFFDESAKVWQKYDQNKDSNYARYTHRPVVVVDSQCEPHDAVSTESSAVFSATTAKTPDSSIFYNPDVQSIDDTGNAPADSARFSGGQIDYRSAAWLIEGDPTFPQIQSEYSESLNQSWSDEDFFDLDIDYYYANGNNACGFIPGAPVVLNTNGLSKDEVILEADTTASWFESNKAQSDVHRNQTSQLGLPDRIKECTILLKHFVDVIAPSMDIFDSDAYFGRHFPCKVKHSSMLRLAVAAVAAKQITRNIDRHDREKVLANISTIGPDSHSMKAINWHYKAADYYDEGISYLRLCLLRSSGSSSPCSSKGPSTFSEASASPDTVRSEPPNKRRRRESYDVSFNDEELLSAIAVFSLYESMNGSVGEWKQHVAGFHSLLKNIILPRAPLESLSPARYLASINGGCASFWNIVRADFFAAHQHRTRTQVDPNNMILWKAAGLRVVGETPFSSSTQNGGMDFDHTREDDECRSLMWILTKITNFLNRKAQSSSSQPSSTWSELRALLEMWYESLSTLFKPYASVPFGEPSETAVGGSKSRFEQFFFTAPMCAVALQLYHFAQLLLLMNWPVESVQRASRLRLFGEISRESQHHGRQICNIALGIRDHLPAYELMIEPLYAAGICLEENEDRSIVIDLLGSMEKDTGNSARKRTRELLSTWGWEDRQDRRILT